MLGLARLAGGGQHHREPAPGELDDEVGGAVQRPYLGDELTERLVVGRAQVVAAVTLDVVAEHGRDQLVAAHADGAVQPPHRDVEVAPVGGPGLGDGVVVGRVDERAVDIEQNGVRSLRNLAHPV